MNDSKHSVDRQILVDAQKRGATAQLGAWLRLSGPGWLQSAITLGGGSLIGALYLGVLGGTSMLWLQIIAIILGVVMLSAISYVTLSTGVRPYKAINQYVNPVLGVGWIAATILANMIFILPQFSLCFDSIDNNLLPGMVNGEFWSHKLTVTLILAVVATAAVLMSIRGGAASRIFDWILKAIVALIVVCFVGVVVWLARSGLIDWQGIWWGLVPNPGSWNSPAPAISAALSELPENISGYWESRILGMQHSVMISTAATAVGINMTFLLPYSMIARGWDRPFRGLARFDLIAALAIPFILVTSCIVIASSHAFHAKADAAMLGDDVETIASSKMFLSSLNILEDRWRFTAGDAAMSDIDAMPRTTKEELEAREAARKSRLAEFTLSLSLAERKMAATLVKPNTNQLAESLTPIFSNPQTANRVFGLGALAMGFSTIIILMLINGYAFAEVFGDFQNGHLRAVGALLAGTMGFCWIWIWSSGSRTWLVMAASAFAAILLPIAYLAFFLLMNNSRLLGDQMPRGRRRWIWNILMSLGVLGAVAQAVVATMGHIETPATGNFVIGGLSTFLLLALIGFSARSLRTNGAENESDDTE